MGNHSPISSFDDLRRIWYEILDSQLGELDKRFSDEVYNTMKTVSYMLPSSPHFGSEELVDMCSKVCQLFDLPVLPDSEFEVFVSFMRKRIVCEKGLVPILDHVSADIFQMFEVYWRC